MCGCRVGTCDSGRRCVDAERLGGIFLVDSIDAQRAGGAVVARDDQGAHAVEGHDVGLHGAEGDHPRFGSMPASDEGVDPARSAGRLRLVAAAQHGGDLIVVDRLVARGEHGVRSAMLDEDQGPSGVLTVGAQERERVVPRSMVEAVASRARAPLAGSPGSTSLSSL
ncbi:MAG: hypothetical protein ACR2JU_01810 [Nocardioidaceae bacterium]